MEKEIAKEVNSLVEEGIAKLNDALMFVKKHCDHEQYESFRNSIAYPIGYLDDVLDKHIYQDHPELRPYDIDD